MRYIVQGSAGAGELRVVAAPLTHSIAAIPG